MDNPVAEALDLTICGFCYRDGHSPSCPYKDGYAALRISSKEWHRDQGGNWTFVGNVAGSRHG